MRADGFTLIEVLVAMFLMGLGVLAAAPMFVYAMQTNAGSADVGIVSTAALERMELLRAAPYTSLSLGGSLDSDVTGFSDVDPEFSVRWSIEQKTTAPTNAKVITLRALTTASLSGRSREVTLVTVRGAGE